LENEDKLVTYLIPVSPWGPVLLVTLAAINWPSIGWFERYFALLTTVRTSCLMHLARSPVPVVHSDSPPLYSF